MGSTGYYRINSSEYLYTTFISEIDRLNSHVRLANDKYVRRAKHKYSIRYFFDLSIKFLGCIGSLYFYLYCLGRCVGVFVGVSKVCWKER